MADYVSHLADDRDRGATVCGEPWQGWQAPDWLPLGSVVVAPYKRPRPHLDEIRLCVPCRRAGVAAGMHCEIFYGDDGEPVARVQLAGDVTAEEREAIRAVIDAVRGMSDEEIADAAERGRARRRGEGVSE